MQASDICFWAPENRRGLRSNSDWMLAAVGAAAKHKANLKTIIGCTAEDILQVNVFSLHTLGSTKKHVLEKLKGVLPQLQGITVVF